jgi:hypothetical protein
MADLACMAARRRGNRAVYCEAAGDAGADLYQRERSALCFADGGGEQIVLEDARPGQLRLQELDHGDVPQAEVGRVADRPRSGSTTPGRQSPQGSRSPPPARS